MATFLKTVAELGDPAAWPRQNTVLSRHPLLFADMFGEQGAADVPVESLLCHQADSKAAV